ALRLARSPDHAVGNQAVAPRARSRRDTHDAAGGIDRLDEQRLAVRDAKAAPLTDRVAMHARVRAEDAPVFVHERPGPRAARRHLLDELRVAAIGNEADLLAVGLGGGRDAARRRV